MAQFDVFISHSSKDKAAADAVCATLEQRKIRCWVAPRDIPPGVEWAEAIISGIERSQIMVLVFSSHANDSKQVQREIERAVAKGLVIIPFRIQALLPTKSLEYYLSATHWLDAFSPPFEVHLNNLADAVRRIVGPRVEVAAPRPATPIYKAPAPKPVGTKRSSSQQDLPSRSKSTQNSWNVSIAIGCSAVVLAVGSWLVWRPSSSVVQGDKTALSVPTPAKASPFMVETLPKVRFKLPMDRTYFPPDAAICIQLISGNGYLNRKGQIAGPNELVSEWHDIAELGNDNFARSVGAGVESDPRVIDWSTLGDGARTNRYAIDSRSNDGQRRGMRSVEASQDGKQLPFGTQIKSWPPGVTLAAVLQGMGPQADGRVLTLEGSDAFLSLRIDAANNLVAEAKNGQSKIQIASTDVDATRACLAVISWDSVTNEVQFSTRNGDGKRFRSSPGHLLIPPTKPLGTLHLGHSSNTEPVGETFNGVIGEVVVFSTSIKYDQSLLLEKGLADYYFRSTPRTSPTIK